MTTTEQHDQRTLIAGAMSGTSADGVDVAIVIPGENHTPKLLGEAFEPFDSALTDRIHRLRGQSAATSHAGCLREIATVTREVSLAYVRAIRAACDRVGMPSDHLHCVGAHGQTLFHDPPLTIQVFDPSLVSFELGCKVVSDFRRADLAVGGQGAPLVPMGDAIMFGSKHEDRVVVNIGGIANLSYLPRGLIGVDSDIRAWDCGPGNCLSDAICRSEGLGRFDDGGNLASQGRADEGVVEAFLREEFMQRSGPKSTDGPAMWEAWLRSCATRSSADWRIEDRLATACAAAGRGIARDVLRLERESNHATPIRVIVAGGGARNVRIMAELSRESGRAVEQSDALGVPTHLREAMAFALIAWRTLRGESGNVPSATGARCGVVLGSVSETRMKRVQIERVSD
jgi:anhydro-N-acetylmuramic acid kinase